MGEVVGDGAMVAEEEDARMSGEQMLRFMRSGIGLCLVVVMVVAFLTVFFYSKLLSWN